MSEPIARILVVGTEKAASGGKTGTSNFDGMLGSDTGHLEFLQLAFGNTHVLRQQTGRIVIAAGDAAVGVVQENLNDASTFRAACDDITSERIDHKFRRKIAGPLDPAALYQIPEHNGPGRYFVEYRKIKRPFPPTAEYRKIKREH